MAVQWNVIKLPISTDSDFAKIVSELDNREEDGWDLEQVAANNGVIVLFFKKRIE